MKRIIVAILLLFGTFPILQSQTIQLTQEEKDWLKDNSIVYHGYDAGWQPLEFLDDNGDYSGIAKGVLDLLEIKTGLDFRIKECPTWEDAIQMVKNNEIQILPALMPTDERREFMLFTEPYQAFDFVIVTKTKGDFIGGVNDLKGKKVALPEGYYITNLIKEKYPELDIIEEKGVNECLMAVSSNKAVASIGNLAVVSYYLNYKGYQNIKIASPTYVKPMKVCIGVAKSEVILHSIIQKGLNAITPKEMNTIVQDWVSVRYEHGVDMAEIWRKVYIGVGIVLVIIFIIFIWNRVLKKEINLRKKAEAELLASLSLIKEQKLLIEEKNREVTDSIMYAKRIQEALLPTNELLLQHFPKSFVLYLPKDIVAGDFYWFEVINGLKFIAAADCTGHGVPGAMVSIVCHNALHRATREYGLTDPGQILDKTREIVIDTFSKYDANIKDGMDIALLVYDEKKKDLKYAGANNSLYQVENETKEIFEIKADKQPVGLYGKEKPFTTHTVDLSLGEKVYMFSDGYADQFGGGRGKKMKYKPFKSQLLTLSSEPFPYQKEELEKYFEEWKGDYEQIDDVLVMAIEFKD